MTVGEEIMESVLKEIEKLRSQNARYRAALELVADLSEPKSITEEYWRTESWNDLVWIIMEDTRIAREALKEVDDGVS